MVVIGDKQASQSGDEAAVPAFIRRLTGARAASSRFDHALVPTLTPTTTSTTILAIYAAHCLRWAFLTLNRTPSTRTLPLQPPHRHHIQAPGLANDLDKTLFILSRTSSNAPSRTSASVRPETAAGRPPFAPYDGLNTEATAVAATAVFAVGTAPWVGGTRLSRLSPTFWKTTAACKQEESPCLLLPNQPPAPLFNRRKGQQ